MALVRLERVRRAENEARYYELSLEQDLFGWWVVRRCWGRIGTEGDGATAAEAFATREAAEGRMREVIDEKLGDGYERIGTPPETRRPAAEDPATRRLLVADGSTGCCRASPNTRKAASDGSRRRSRAPVAGPDVPSRLCERRSKAGPRGRWTTPSSAFAPASSNCSTNW